MKLENIKVAARLRESTAAFFKVNKLILSEDEKSINISSLNDTNRNNSKQGNFDNCFGKFSRYSDILKGTECSKYLKQLLHGYNAAILSFGVGESDVPGTRNEFLIENLDNLKKLMEQNSYRYDYSLSFTIFGVSDGHCVNLLNYKKCNSLEISAFLQDFELMESIEDLDEVKRIILKGYSLPILVFIQLRTESKNEIEKTAANVSNLCLGDLGSLSNPSMEKSISNLKSLILTLDQTFVSGELRVRESPLTHLLSPFFGGNSNTLVLMEILTNSSFSAVSDAFLFAEALRKVKNRVEQVFENYLAEEVEELMEQNEKLTQEKSLKEQQLKQLNYSLSRLLSDQEIIKGERDLLSIDNEAQKFLLDYNLSRMEVEKLEVKEKMRLLKLEMVQLDHQKALKNSQAFNESIGRRRAEFELNKAIRIVRETENSFGGQIGSLRERILHASDELQRSVEERTIMQSKLQNSQQRIDQLNTKLREVEISRTELERQKSNDSKLERIKGDLELEIRSMRRQLEQAKESEKALNETVYRVEGRSDQSRREIMELERELRILKTENSLLQSKLATKESVGAVSGRSKPPITSMATGTPMIPNIPIINVPNNQRQQSVPLEILVDSPVERRNTKRLSAGNKTSSPIKKVKADSSGVTGTPGGMTVTSTPAAATPSVFIIPNSNENINGGNKGGLSSLLEGVGKKKIKLPERSAKITITSSQNNQNPQAEIPRSTPIGKSKSTAPSVMDSIMSSFNVKIPTIKK